MAALIVLPLGILYARAFSQTDAAGRLLASLDLALLGRTLALACTVAVAGTLLGLAAGQCLGAREWRGRNTFRLLLLLPLAVPPYVHAVGWTNLLRADGPVSRASEAMGFSPSFTTDAIYSFGGAAFVLMLAYFPIAALLVEKALTLSPYSLVEAAAVFGANKRQSFWHARWPYLRSATLTSGVILLLLTAAELGVPTILKVSVFNFEVFTYLSAFNDFGTATILATPLIATGVVLVVFERQLLPNEEVQSDLTEAGRQPAATMRYTLRSTVFLLACLAVAFGLPIGYILSAAFDRNALYEMGRVAGDPARATIVYGLSASIVALLIGGIFAATLRNSKRWRYRLSDTVLIVGFAVPGVILALGLLAGVQTFAPVAVSATILVVLALLARYTILPYRTLVASYAQIPDEFFEAAKVEGATARQIVQFVVMPLLRVPLLTAFLIVFVLSVGEIGSTIMLYPPGGETLPIALYSIEANSPRAYVAAMALYEVLLCLLPFLALLIAYVLLRGTVLIMGRRQ